MKALQSWSPRARPLDYDSLQQDIGCQDAYGTAVFSVLPFSRICIAEHLTGSIFDRLDTVSYARGPLNTGDVLPWITSWAAWVSSSGVRVAKLPFITLPANGTGTASAFYGTSKPPKVSINFASNGQIALAIQKTTQSIEIKWFKDSSGINIGAATFLGTSGVLFQTGLIPHDEDGIQNDLAVYYVRREVPRTIFVRVKRDDFATEYVLNQNLQADISQLLAVEAQGAKIVLYGRDDIGRDITLYTADYRFVIDGDNSTLRVSFYRGRYNHSAVTKTTATHKTTLHISVASGSYDDPIQEPASPLSLEPATLNLSVYSGEYF